MAAKSETGPQLAAPARSKINVVLFSGSSGFPGDEEYRPEDLYTVQSLMQGGFRFTD